VIDLLNLIITPQPIVQQVEPNLPALQEVLYLPDPIPITNTVHLLLKLEARRVYVYEGEILIASYPVAIGKTTTPTPLGEFQVFEMITDPVWQNPVTGEVETAEPDGSLGKRWVGFSQQSSGVIGFHGTPNVASIGQAASNGCIRMLNEDVVQLFEKVTIGTIVKVEP
jgi:lipoprotein-anchoring transpeptidase ErfK/SrfK